MIDANSIERFCHDGVVPLYGVLNTADLAIARAAFDWSVGHPGRGASKHLIAGSPGSFYGDLANPKAFDAYARVHDETPLPDLVSALWGKPEVWFMYEQVFVKTGASDEAARRTPWHQDLPYLPIEGDDLAVIWIPFEPLSEAESLEFVLASHRGTLFDGSRFDPDDDTIPLYGTGELPRLPDIEASREDYEIVSFAVEPGDVVAFHPAMLHGGASAPPNKQRNTLSLRYFGEAARVAWRPGDTPERIAAVTESESVHPMALAKKAGQGAPFRHPRFPLVHPR